MNRKQRRAEKKLGRPAPQGGSPGVQELFTDALRHHQAGRLNDAERLYRQVLAVDPRHADSLHLLGVIAHQIGRHDLAVELISKAIAINAKDASYHSNLGLAHEAQGKLDEAVACYRQALVLKPVFAEAHNNLGIALRKQGRLNEAIACFRRALDLKPNYAEAHGHMGFALQGQGRLDEAVACYRQALVLKPDFAEAHNNLGNALQEQGKLDEAEACFRQALVLNPDFAAAHNNLGAALMAQGELDEAVACYRQALVLKPDFAEAHNNMGNVLRSLGRLKEARDYFEKAIRLAPKNPVFYFSLAASKQFAAGDPHLAAMQELAQDIGRLNAEQQIYLHFGLGKALADVKQHEQAFHYLLQGNALKRQQIAYDEAATLEFFQRIQTVFTPELMRSKQGPGNPSTVPVFILGMPRSGTTLVEQILASHPKIFGAGERDDFKKAVIRLSDRKRVSFPELVSTVSDEDLRQLGTSYLDVIRATAPEALRITDKMLLNFHYIGLIHLALPHARIIHTRRDPIDTCLSCFSTLFTANQPFSYDLAELGRYYRAYEALMQHWRNVLPNGVMLEVQYEQVVDDLEGQARRLVAHCGLDWDDACLAFHKTQRPVWTASVTQVRQPIYKSAVGRWRVYERFLGPLTKALAG
jgi:tetratricopeptide (TPR) repeat protein